MHFMCVSIVRVGAGTSDFSVRVKMESCVRQMYFAVSSNGETYCNALHVARGY